MQRKRRLGAEAALPQAGPLTGFDLEFHLLGDAERVVDLDAKVTDGAFELCVTALELVGDQPVRWINGIVLPSGVSCLVASLL